MLRGERTTPSLPEEHDERGDSEAGSNQHRRNRENVLRHQTNVSCTLNVWKRPRVREDRSDRSQ